MPKTVHTPRDELICGKIDRALELLQGIEKGERGVVDLAFTLHSIGHDAQRMEVKLAARKAEVAALTARVAEFANEFRPEPSRAPPPAR